MVSSSSGVSKISQRGRPGEGARLDIKFDVSCLMLLCQMMLLFSVKFADYLQSLVDGNCTYIQINSWCISTRIIWDRISGKCDGKVSI